MSVIADALKKAQRERMRRTSTAGGMSPAGPLVVRLRTAPARFSWTRAIGIGVGAALVVAAVAMIVEFRRSTDGASLPAVPPPPPADRLVEAPVRTRRPDTAVPRAAQRAASGGASTIPSHAPSAPSAAPPTADATPPVASARQGRARTDSGAAPATLRISVDRPQSIQYAQWFEEAVAAHRANDVVAARERYERLLGIAPDDPDLLNNFAVLLSSQREFDRATTLLRRAVVLAPANAGAWANLGFALREQGKANESIAALQRALAIDPSRPGVRVNLAQQYLAIGAMAQARESVDKLLADEPSSPEAHYTLGQLLELQGDRAGAVREYLDFLRLAPPRLTSYAQRVREHLDSLGARPSGS